MRKYLAPCTLAALFTIAASTRLVSAATATWSGAGGDQKWSNAGNWTGAQPDPTNDIKFFDPGADATISNVNNIVDTTLTVLSLQYGNTNNFHTTLISQGVTLTNLGNLVAGTETDNGIFSMPAVTITGPGKLVMSNTAASIIVRQGSTTGASVGSKAILNLSGLDTLIADISRIGVAESGLNRPSGQLFLAKTNIISASGGTPAISLGLSGSNNGGGGTTPTILSLGLTNAIFANSIAVGRQKQTTVSMVFNTAAFTDPVAFFRGLDGISRIATWAIGDGENNSGTTSCNGTCNFTGGTVDAQVTAMTVGRASSSTSGTGNSVGTLTFERGTVDINTLQVGLQTANTGKNATGTVNVNGVATLVVNASFELVHTTGGAGAATTTGTLNINGGTVRANNITCPGAGSSTINLNGGTLIVTNSVATSSQPLTSLSLSNAVLQVSLTGASIPFNVNNLTVDGQTSDTNVIDIVALPVIVNFPSTLALIKAVNPMTLLNGSFNFVLRSLPAGYAGSIVQSADTTAVELVLTNGPVAPSVWTGADIPNHNTNWSDGLNWSSGVAPNPNTLVIFNAAASQSAYALATPGGGPAAIIPGKINNVVDANSIVGAVTFTNLSGSYENTFINNGIVLGITGNGLFVGSSSLDFGNTACQVTVSGPGGTLSVSNNSASVYVGLGDSTLGATPLASLDLSGLGSFNANVANFLLGVGGYASTFTTVQPAGVVYLAQTNTLTILSSQTDVSDSAPVALEVGDADTQAGATRSTLYLGLTNAIFADNVAVGRQLASGGIFFNPAVTNSGPTAWFRGVSTNAVNTWTIGDGVLNSLTVTAAGTNDFSGGLVDILVNTMYVAKPSPASLGVSAVNGTLTFGAGTINANTLNVSYNAAASDGNIYNYGVGIINVDGPGTLVVNNTLNLGFANGLLAGGTPTATLNLRNGAAWVNTIVAGTNGVTSTINVIDGSLGVTNTAGTTVAPLGALNLTNATLALGVASSQATITATSLNADGVNSSHNTLNIISLPAIASYPVTLTLIQSVNPINLAGGSFNFVLGGLPAASPAYTAIIAESADHTAILLTVTGGPAGIRPSVTWSGADVPNLNTNWSDRLNWQLPGAPGSGDNVIFNNSGTQSASVLGTPGGGLTALIPGNFDNIVDANFTIATLAYLNTGGSYHNTEISNNGALNTGALTVGGFDSGAAAQQEFVTVAGANATLNVNTTNANLPVWIGSGSVGGSQATLDLSALDNFNASISRFMVGATVGNSVNRPSGIVYLAKTNTIAAAFQTTTIEAGTTTGNAGIVVADCNQNNGSPSFIYLGQVNTISADSIGIGRQKAVGHLLFNPIYANLAPYASVKFQGFSSNEISVFDVGDGVGNTGTTTLTADVDLTGGQVTAAINTMNIGRASSGSGSGTTTGSLEFDAGTMTVNALNIGLQPASGTKVGIGTLSVGSNTVMGVGATLVVTGNLSLGSAGGGAGATTTSGTLNISNGTVMANAVVAGVGSVSTINVSGGRLVVANTIGNSAAPLGMLNLVPLGTADNSSTVLQLAAGATASVTVSTLNLDGQATTTNRINIGSVGPIGATPIELPLIQYGTMSLLTGSTFNLGLGTLPSGYTGYLTNDTANSLVGLVITGAAPPRPAVITGFSVQSKTNLVLTGTNGAVGGLFYVLSSTNVALPLTSWTPLLTNNFSGAGGFTVTLPYSATEGQRFYLLQSR